MTRRNILVSLGALALVALVAGAWFVLSPSGDGGGAASSAAASNGDQVTDDDKVMGNAAAPVTVIEYFSQACSACAHFSQTILPQLKAKYIDTGKVRYVMRPFPLFPIDGPSYKLDLCVPKESFFQAVDLLFRYQPEWDTAEYPHADPAGLPRMAQLLGLPDVEGQACMNAKFQDAAINKIAKDGVTRYAVGSTPTLVIDFKKADIQKFTWDEVQTAIDAALAAKGAK